ncbi:MAG: hypothetical protein DWQ02_26130, partial [Bacteroidetes bacterium]
MEKSRTFNEQPVSQKSKITIMTGKRTITPNNLTFDCYTAGDEKDPLVLLLHGFPETAHMWLALMEELSDSGFYCV